MPRQKVIRRDARGHPYLDYARPVEAAVTDVRTHLRDGEALRIPLYLQDADRRPPDDDDDEEELTGSDRAFAVDHRPGGPFVVDRRRAPTIDASAHRPGFRDWRPPRGSVDHARAVTLNAMRDEAYAEYDREMASQYQRDAMQNALSFTISGVGAPGRGNGQPEPGAYPYRAELEGAQCTINGAPGTLQRDGDWLVCKPTRTDAVPVGDATAQAYQQYDEEMANAWKNR